MEAREFVEKLWQDAYRYSWRYVMWFGVPATDEQQADCLDFIMQCMRGVEAKVLIDQRLRSLYAH